MTSEQLCSALVSRTSERTDLGFTRDRHLKMRKSGKPDLRARAKIRDLGATRWSAETMWRFAILTLGQRKSGLPDLRHPLPISGKPEIGVSFRSRKSARCTRPRQERYCNSACSAFN